MCLKMTLGYNRSKTQFILLYGGLTQLFSSPIGDSTVYRQEFHQLYSIQTLIQRSPPTPILSTENGYTYRPEEESKVRPGLFCSSVKRERFKALKSVAQLKGEAA